MSSETLAYISDPVANRIQSDIILFRQHSRNYYGQKAGIMALFPEQTYPWHLYQAMEFAKRHSCEVDDLDRSTYNLGLILMGTAIIEQAESEGNADYLKRKAYSLNQEQAKFDLDFQNSPLFENLLRNIVKEYSKTCKMLFVVGCTEAWSLSLQAKCTYSDKYNSVIS